MFRVEENPAFHDFSLVYLPYCSSDVYTGTREGGILTQVTTVTLLQPTVSTNTFTSQDAHLLGLFNTFRGGREGHV